MKAVVYTKYGPPEVLHLEDIDKPAPQNDEVLIRIAATTATSGDWRARSLIIPRGFGFISRLVFGYSKPKQPVLGSEFAGKIEAVGKDVTRFDVGDLVFGNTELAGGCYAEYTCISQDSTIALKPENLTLNESAALTFGGGTALKYFAKAKLQQGDKVLINGASGAVGTAAIQIAKHFGAEVTGVCSGANAEMVRSLGANHVIDYTTTDFTQNGETYDIIMDNVGTAPYSRSKRSLKKGGRLIMVLGTLAELLKIPWVSLTSNKKLLGGPVISNAEDIEALRKLAVDGEYKPFIERTYPLEEIVEAHRHVDTGRKRGNVVITIG